jgi:hypothetical protein
MRFRAYVDGPWSDWGPWSAGFFRDLDKANQVAKCRSVGKYSQYRVRAYERVERKKGNQPSRSRSNSK